MKTFARMRKETLIKQIHKFRLPIPSPEKLTVEQLRKQITIHIKDYLESWFLRRVRSDILPQFPSLLAPGRNRTYLPGSKLEFDFSWRSLRIAVEIQGGLNNSRSGHTSAVGIKRDMRKQNLCVVHQWQLLQLHAEQITDDARWHNETLPMLKVLIVRSIANYAK